MWELDCEEGWAPKNWCFWTVVLEKTLESPLDWKEIQPVHSEGDQPWDFFEGNDAEAETPVLWPSHVKSWLIGKDSDPGRDWEQEEKVTTEGEMAGWHHWLDGLELRELVMDREARRAAIHGVAKSWTRLSNWAELNWTELEIRENIYKSLPPWSGQPLMPPHSYTIGMRYKADHGMCCVCWNFSISWCRHAEGAFEGRYTNEIMLGQRLLGTVERMNKRRLKLRVMVANVWSFQNPAPSCPPKHSRILSSKDPKVELATPSSTCICTFFGTHLQFSQFHPLRDSFFFFFNLFCNWRKISLHLRAS